MLSIADAISGVENKIEELGDDLYYDNHPVKAGALWLLEGLIEGVTIATFVTGAVVVAQSVAKQFAGRK